MKWSRDSLTPRTRWKRLLATWDKLEVEYAPNSIVENISTKVVNWEVQIHFQLDYVLFYFSSASARASDSARLDFGIEEAKFWGMDENEDEDELDDYEIIGRERNRL